MKSNSPLCALRRLIFVSLIIFLPKLANAQGTLYVSSIVTTIGRFGGMDVDGNSWIAEQIETGGNSSGYVLDSIQLVAGDVVPGESGFGVSIYSDVNNLPSGDLENLTGPSDPAGGVSTYSASGLALAPSSEYFVVATASGLVEWVGGTSPSATGSDQWMIGGLNLVSGNQGSTWTSFDNGDDMQMAVYATAVPEPSESILILLGGMICWMVRCAKSSR